MLRSKHTEERLRFLVFAVYRAEIRIVDAVKKAALSRLILDNIMSTEPGELLDEKLANVALPVGLGERKLSMNFGHFFPAQFPCLVPPPSTDDSAWWKTLGEFSYRASKGNFSDRGI